MSNVDQKEHGLDPGGGIWDRLDVSRREIVQQLCGEKGLTLFSFLLESSTINNAQENEAVFSLQRLCDVAAQLGWSPDTVKRYVATFRAVNLVYHYHDCRREVKLHLPLGPYAPLTNFSALDELIGKRKKQRQLALKVKLRYIARFGDPTQTHSHEMRQTLQEVKAILDDEHLEPLKRERLQMKLADVLTRLMNDEIEHRQGDLNTLLGDRPDASSSQSPSFTEGDSNKRVEAVCLTKQEVQRKEPSHKGDSDQQEGDSKTHTIIGLVQAKKRAGDSNQQLGDLLSPMSSTPNLQVERTGDSNQQLGDSTTDTHMEIVNCLQTAQHTQGDPNQQLGDSIFQENTQRPQKDGQMGDLNRQVQPEEGDSTSQVVEVHADAPYTYNVNYLISNITENNVIRKRMAQFLASILEEKEYDNGYPTFSKYLKAFKVYSPNVIGRAFLVTMVLLHRKHWRVEKPGATFTDQCRILSGQLPFAHYTLDEVEEWMRTWGGLSYSELIEALAIPALQQVTEPAQLVTKSRMRSYTSTKSTSSLHTGNSVGRKKRTYGLQFTGRPITLNKGTHNLSSPTPPSGKS